MSYEFLKAVPTSQNGFFCFKYLVSFMGSSIKPFEDDSPRRIISQAPSSS